MKVESKNELVVLNKFEGMEVGIITDENGNLLFEIYSTGMALGHVKTNTIKGKTYTQCRKDRVDKTLENADIQGLVRNGLIYLTEEMLYDFMLEARTDKCKAFRKWVTSEILPSINKNGGYIAKNASEEQVDKLTKYSLPKLKNTFKTENIEQIHNIYEDVKDFYKNNYRDTDFRLKMMKNIEKGLNERIDNYAQNKQVAFITICDDLIKTIKEDKEELRLRISGGQKAYKTRTINIQGKLLDEKNEMLSDLESKLNYYEPDNNEWIELTTHPFSHNYMTTVIEDKFTGKPKIIKSEEYKKWQNKFPYHLLPSFNELGVDFKERVCVWFRFIAKSAFDSTNCHKTSIDTICKYYGVDDNKVELMECKKIDTCDNYWDGKIYVAFRNQ